MTTRSTSATATAHDHRELAEPPPSARGHGDRPSAAGRIRRSPPHRSVCLGHGNGEPDADSATKPGRHSTTTSRSAERYRSLARADVAEVRREAVWFEPRAVHAHGNATVSHGAICAGRSGRHHVHRGSRDGPPTQRLASQPGLRQACFPLDCVPGVFPATVTE